MRTTFFGVLWISLICSGTPAMAQNEAELDALRTELAQMRADYELRIAQLEKRLDEAERKASEQQDASTQTEPQMQDQANPWKPDPYTGQMAESGINASNPAIGVVFQGQVWSYSNDPDNYGIPGFPLGGEAGPLPPAAPVVRDPRTGSRLALPRRFSTRRPPSRNGGVALSEREKGSRESRSTRWWWS